MAEAIDSQRLLSFVERYERLEEEKKGPAEDQKELLAEAKATGFEPKYIRKLVAERKQDPEKRKIDNETYELYRRAVGLDD
jgi:uncharacterized protein (UPF0335 family)